MFLAAKRTKKAIFFASVLLLSGLVGFLFFSDELNLKTAKAGASQNVSGWAWSENIGWVSFNSTTGGGGVDYGVNIADDGVFSGYAWSENIGLIDFAPAGPYPALPNYSVRVNLATGEVTGWARALSYGGGWDGWLKMYNVSIDTQCVSPSYQEFSGWAWGSEVVGWLHFAGSNYKVQTTYTPNTDPTVGGLSVDQGNYCVLAFHPRFYWDFSDLDEPCGDSQNAYQVQIDDDTDIGAEPLLDSCSPSPGTCASGHTAESYTPASPSSFTYNTTYYWRVKVWDNRGGESGWAQGQFTTPLHKYPLVDFTWLPLRPSEGEFTQFCAVQQAGICPSDVSKCYTAGGGEISCASASFAWTFPQGTEFSTTTTATSKNPEVKFPETGWLTVYLNITDAVGSCTSSENIRVSVPLPKWKEVAP